MTTGVLLVLLAGAWFLTLRLGRPIGMSVIALLCGVVLAASGSPIAEMIGTLVGAGRDVITALGSALGGDG